MALVVRSIVVAGIVLCAQSTRGQDVVTLSQAMQAALQHNRSLAGAKSLVREADARALQAKSAYLPRFSLVESWQRGDQPVFVFSSLLASRQFSAANFAIDSLNAPSPTGFFHAAIAFDQVIFDGRTSASVDAARLRTDVARLSSEEAAVALTVSTTEAYGRVLSAQATVRAADSAITAAEEDARRAALRRDAGTLTDADVLAMAAHIAQVRERRIQAAGDADIAKAELNRLMGMPIERDFMVLEPTSLEAAPTATPLVSLFAEAERNRADLQRTAAAERLADAVWRQARASWYPQVAAEAQVEANGTQLNERASSWIVGGQVRWTFSTGGAERAERAAALEAASRARIEREDVRAAAQVEIVTALRRLESARARQQLAQSAVDQARESQRIIRDRFEAGLAGTNDVLRAASAVFDVESQRISALVDAISGSAALDRAIGRSSMGRSGS